MRELADPSMKAMRRRRPRNSGSAEPIVNGVIDLGRLATDALFLGSTLIRENLTPFSNRRGPDDPEDHPFAALKALKNDLNSPDGKKSEQD